MRLRCGKRVSHRKGDFYEHNSVASDFCVDISHYFSQLHVRGLKPLAGIHFQSFEHFFAAHPRSALSLSLKVASSQSLYNKVVSRLGGKERVIPSYNYTRRRK